MFSEKYTFSEQNYTAKWIKADPHQCVTLKFHNRDGENILKSHREKKEG